jgi:hypothetical protein
MHIVNSANNTRCRSFISAMQRVTGCSANHLDTVILNSSGAGSCGDLTLLEADTQEFLAGSEMMTRVGGPSLADDILRTNHARNDDLNLK